MAYQTILCSSCEIAGLEVGIEYNFEVDTLIEAAETPGRIEFKRIREAQGLEAALAWRDARLRRP